MCILFHITELWDSSLKKKSKIYESTPVPDESSDTPWSTTKQDIIRATPAAVMGLQPPQ